MDTEGTDGVFTFTVKNNSDAPLRMTTPIELFTVEVLDAKGNRKWNNDFNLTIEAVPGADGKVPDILTNLPPRTVGEYKVRVPFYASSAPGPEDTLEFTYTPNPAKSPELRMTWKILGADLVK